MLNSFELDLYGEIGCLCGNESFRTKTFSDIFTEESVFTTFITEECGIPCLITETSLITLYYLLYARYGNSHIASSDENQFKYKVAGVIFQYGPTWEKELEIQAEIRALTADEIVSGTKQIVNHAYNPSTLPSTDTDEILTKIDQQNVMSYKKSPLEGYSNLLMLLQSDVSEKLLSKFKNLFLKIVNPELPLLYRTSEE